VSRRAGRSMGNQADFGVAGQRSSCVVRLQFAKMIQWQQLQRHLFGEPVESQQHDHEPV